MTPNPASTAPQEASQAPRRLVSAEEAAEYLGISQWSVRDLYARGVLPCVRLGRRVLLDRRDLDAWIDREKRRA